MDVWIIKFELLLKIAVFIVPIPISRLVIGVIEPIPTLPLFKIVNLSKLFVPNVNDVFS